MNVFTLPLSRDGSHVSTSTVALVMTKKCKGRVCESDRLASDDYVRFKSIPVLVACALDIRLSDTTVGRCSLVVSSDRWSVCVLCTVLKGWRGSLNRLSKDQLSLSV